MSGRSLLIGLAALAAAAAAGVALWWYLLCERECSTTQRQAEELVGRGEHLSALTLIDRVDARCRCSRFTSGDAPPEYSLAQVCIRRLRADGRGVELEQLRARASGSILQELLHASPESTERR